MARISKRGVVVGWRAKNAGISANGKAQPGKKEKLTGWKIM